MMSLPPGSRISVPSIALKFYLTVPTFHPQGAMNVLSIYVMLLHAHASAEALRDDEQCRDDVIATRNVQDDVSLLQASMNTHITSDEQPLPHTGPGAFSTKNGSGNGAKKKGTPHMATPEEFPQHHHSGSFGPAQVPPPPGKS